MSVYEGVLILFFSISISIGNAQAPFYSSHVEHWKSEMPPPENELLHSVVLIGDLKNPASDSTMINFLKEKLMLIQSKGSVILLGDLVYPYGLPVEEDEDYLAAKADIDGLLSALKDFQGNIVFLPGNHDWDRGQKDGWEHVKNEEAYVKGFFGRENVYFTEGGCPGPVEVHLSDDVVAIVFDSQWIFQKNEKPGPDACDFEDEAGLFIEIEDIIRRNKGKKIIFAAHHPLFSAGEHGGYFPTFRLLFPLLDMNKSLYIPLPGFIYTAYRKYLGNIQDLAHPEYKKFRQHLLRIFNTYPNIIYAAGHEHGLQFFKHNELNHIVSGGGGEGLYVARNKKNQDFAYGHIGLSILSFYKNGDAWVEFWIPDGSKQGKLVYRQRMFNQKVYSASPEKVHSSSPDFSDSTVIVKLTDRYSRSKFTRFWMGNNYRNVWAAKVELPVFDIAKEHGGLKILKRGGGQQTRSVRMTSADKKQYVLRSVNKYVEKVLGEEFQNTIAEDAVQDAISASFPYAALTIPKLADAAGVMHTNPKIVWVPDDPNLGIYRKDLANNIYLYEERPAEKREDVNSFGNSKKIVNTLDAVKETQREHDHIIDQQAVLRARLFDMLINDWDRHDDQWRWATFKENGQKLYRPVPRDRDQAYFVSEGAAMWLVRQNFIMSKFQGFDYKIRNVKGLGFNARYFDRSFMTEPSLENWTSMAGLLKKNISDELIHQAILDLPPEIYQLSGKEIEAKLRARRDALDIYAEKYYRFLSKEVDVVGTDKRELFKIHRLENGNTDVVVFALSNKKGKLEEQLYHREFKPDETREIRLYGLDGKDKFEFTGRAKKAILTRVIPGKNNDSIIDNSNIRSLGKTILVYDRKDKKNEIPRGKETKRKLSKDKSVDDYNRKQYKYDKVLPLLGFGYNIDDGIFLAAGAHIKRYNFRDSTFHKISGTWAFQTNAFAIDYFGLFSAFSQFFDLEIKAGVSVPRNVDNYFGLGNETRRMTENKTFYRIRYEYNYVNPMLKHTVSKFLVYRMGVFYQYLEVQDTLGRFIGNPGFSGLDSTAYAVHRYAGVNASIEVDTRNSKVMPQRGMHWITDALAYNGMDDNSLSYVKLKSDLSFYLSFTTDPRVIFALRFGGAMNMGDYEFYHANALGGKTNLRGFQSRRFAGDRSFYQNTEIRFKLFNLENYFFNGQSGIYLFNDVGRVWFKDENSDRWHDGYGFGFWLTPFEFTALTLSYNRSSDDHMLAFSFRYLF